MSRLLTANIVTGFCLAALAVAGLWISRNYTVGTATNMGPGYIPRLLCWVLLVIAAISIARDLRGKGEAIREIAFVPGLLILSAVVVFGLTIEPLGLFVASASAIIVASLARERPYRPVQTLVLALSLAMACVAIFVWGLGLPIAAWPVN